MSNSIPMEGTLDIGSYIRNLQYQEQKTIEKVFELKNKLVESEIYESKLELDLWINTDFKAMKLTNGEQRKSYVKRELSKYIRVSSLYKNQIYLCENLLRAIRSKIKILTETDFVIEEYPYDTLIDELCQDLDIE